MDTNKISRIRSYNELEDVKPLKLNHVLWNSIKSVDTTLKLAFDDNYLYLEMRAHEQEPLTRYYKDQDPVYKDSAMEFFLSFDQKSYFNFEFNRTGALLAQYGTTEERIKISSTNLKRIRRSIVLDKTFWSVRLDIPWLVLANHETIDITKPLWFNAYKISETEENLHFQSLFMIESEKPNFHRPDCFESRMLDR
ncbi:carbohydrate-binding family 9-like protein [Erysipelothrix urinaevulpis]|uniref:carbohydrate-binding family 9-like protein n=1 Tax=Erysipelothrix urinaevulpis TaxID=2683717 RepID=UPI0013595A73|nr:carbohydrate-binding family 9-like protein [Erysipelothrix urinaevulpis]